MKNNRRDQQDRRGGPRNAVRLQRGEQAEPGDLRGRPHGGAELQRAAAADPGAGLAGHDGDCNQ